MYNATLKPQKQLSYAFDNGIPLIIWIGEDEIAEGIIKIKILNDKNELKINREELVKEIGPIIESNPVLTAKEDE
jgi:histidyl-tRNA synthetase